MRCEVLPTNPYTPAPPTWAYLLSAAGSLVEGLHTRPLRAAWRKDAASKPSCTVRGADRGTISSVWVERGLLFCVLTRHSVYATPVQRAVVRDSGSDSVQRNSRHILEVIRCCFLPKMQRPQTLDLDLTCCTTNSMSSSSRSISSVVLKRRIWFTRKNAGQLIFVEIGNEIDNQIHHNIGTKGTRWGR